ncbi:MAG: porin [Desulfotignum sp.]|nr:porin [Desulfotignum sp.]
MVPDFRWLFKKIKEKKMKKLMVLVAALALVAASAMTAAAADWNFYGSARVATFYVDQDFDSDKSIGDLLDNDNTSYEQALNGNSRIGANVKVSDELTGGFEYGTGANVRKLFGEWNFGAGSLLVGQTYTPLNMFYSNQVYAADNDLLAQGGVYSGRDAMIRLKFGDFQIAAIAPDTSAIAGLAGTETDFPAIEARYLLTMDAFQAQLAGGYQTYEIGGLDVDSWVVALGGKADFGAVYMGGNVFTGENAGNLMAVSVDGDNAWDDGFAVYDAVNNKIEDNDVLGFMVAAGFKANDMLAFEIGYGWAETDVANVENEVQAYYVQSTITLAPGVFITPEIGMFDGVETGSQETLYYGAKWQINF